MLSNNWHGPADRIEAALKQPGWSAPSWNPIFASAFGYGDLIENLGARVNVCDPLNGINYITRVSVVLLTGHTPRARWRAMEYQGTPPSVGGVIA